MIELISAMILQRLDDTGRIRIYIKAMFLRLKRTREMNNNTNNTSVSHAMLIAHESNYSSDRKSSRKSKVQSPIKETSLVTAESILPQSCVSFLDVDEKNFTYGEQNDTPNKKRQCRDTMQHVPSSSLVFHGSLAQTRRFSPVKSEFHQRFFFLLPQPKTFLKILMLVSFLMKFNKI